MGSYCTHVYYPRGVPAPAWALSAAWAGMGASKNVLSERAVMYQHGLPGKGGHHLWRCSWNVEMWH